MGVGGWKHGKDVEWILQTPYFLSFVLVRHHTCLQLLWLLFLLSEKDGEQLQTCQATADSSQWQSALYTKICWEARSFRLLLLFFSCSVPFPPSHTHVEPAWTISPWNFRVAERGEEKVRIKCEEGVRVWEGGEGGTRVTSLCMDEQVLGKEPVCLGEIGGGDV